VSAAGSTRGGVATAGAGRLGFGDARGVGRTTIRGGRPQRWSPDGTLLAYSHPSDGIRLLDLRNRVRVLAPRLRLAGGWAPRGNGKALGGGVPAVGIVGRRQAREEAGPRGGGAAANPGSATMSEGVPLISAHPAWQALAAHDTPAYQAALKELEGGAVERDLRIVEGLA